MSEPSARLPWHVREWRRFDAMLDAGRVHHAILLTGLEGLGKRAFAERAARALLCEADAPAAGRPCGQCRGCRLTAAGSHPDRLDIVPEEERRQIGVEQVRARVAELTLTPHYATARVALVDPADRLNRHAADALLKTLEEPGASVVFLLVSARPAALPVTVRSRCLRLAFGAAGDDAARSWVEDGRGTALAGADAALVAWYAGAPLAAAEALASEEGGAIASMAEDLEQIVRGELGVIAAAERWRASGLERTTGWQLKIVTGLMRLAAGGDAGAAALATQRITCRLDLPALNAVCEELLELRAAIARNTHPNEQLGLEHLAACWAAAPKRG